MSIILDIKKENREGKTDNRIKYSIHKRAIPIIIIVVVIYISVICTVIG